MAPPKDIARSYPKRGLTADVGFRSEPKFCGDGSVNLDGSTQGAHVATTYDIAATGAKTTIAAWVNYDTATVASAQMIVGNTLFNTTSRLAIYQTATNTLMAGCTHASGTHIQFGSTATLSANRWYFCAATFDKDTATLKFYIDGVEFDTVPALGGGGTSGQFEIGARYNGGSPLLHFDGKVAHAMMIEDVLTQAEIVELMRDTSYAKAQTFGTVNRYYELDADFNDDTGSHNATSYGSPSFTVDRPQLPRGLDLARGAAMARVYSGRALEFDGSADYLATETSAALGDTFTITAWIKRNSAATLDYVVNVGNPGGAGNAISISITNANPGLLYFFDNSTSVNTTNKVEYNTWYHVALTVAPGAGTAKLYMNGIDGTPAHSVNVNITDTTFEIGRYLGASHWFYGWISDVRVYNQTLTADQVKELYHYPEQVLPTGVSASNLIHRWALSDYNDTGGTGGRYFQDSAGSNAMEDKSSASMEFAQPVPCPQLGLQQSATRLRFPGGNTTHNAVATTAALGTTASVSCWFQVENTGVTRVLWAIGNATGTGFLEAFVNSGDQLQVFGQNSFFVATITDSDWHHLVVTTDSGSPPYRIFLDNSEVSLSGSDTARNFTNGTFEIGNQDTAASPFVFQGILNDVACWNTELGDSDVAALYNSGVQGMDVSTVQSANLKGWWKCDDLTTLKDYSGNGANATVTNTFNAASFPENASGSTIVGDFSMKRKGVSVANLSGTTGVNAIIPNNPAVFPTLATGFSFTCALRRQEEGSFGSALFASANNTSQIPPGPPGPPFYNHQFIAYLAGSGRVQFNVGEGTAGGNRATLFSTAGAFSGSEWVHFGCSVDYTTSPATLTIYKNGAVNATNAATALGGVPDVDDMHIGGISAYGIDTETAIANPRFYQTVLTPNEMEQAASSDLRLVKGLNNE